MIPSLFHNHLFLLMLISILGILATVLVEAQRVNISDSLSANDPSKTWQSPLGDFSFGFQPIPGQNDRFLLAIWYAKIPKTTIVWYARGETEDPAIGGRESMVELTRTGNLVLKDPKGNELWRSMSVTNGDDSQVSHAAMLDTGNFVILSNKNSSGYLWETFKYPTDTILPGQELNASSHLLSASAETNYSKGKYQLRFNDTGFLILNQLDVFTEKPYSRPYFSLEMLGSRLIFNESGYIQIRNSTGSTLQDLAPPQNYDPRPELYYFRATLNFDGVLTLYSYPKNPGGNETWSVLWFKPDDICSIVDKTGAFGTGPCGYNSICETIGYGRPNCSCPPGFSFMDENNLYGGCIQDYEYLSRDCNPDGSTIDEDRFEIQSRPFFNFPYGDIGILRPATESECKQSCLGDCSCAVAILNTNGNGTCWKKRLPLSNGRFEGNIAATRALFKVLKSNGSGGDTLNVPRDKNKKPVILILSVLLGTLTFNFVSLAAISLIFFCLYQRRVRDLNGIIPSRRGEHLETNLCCYTYKELEQTTNGFKEEIGKGAFGTVYRGELPSSYGKDPIAVKRLEKFVQEGEKEFKMEVKVIGQTHHKNLVRLIGYCDEGEKRLLVYEFMGNGSLSSFLFGMLRPSWEQRLKIASGIAKGLTYLHEECSTQIIHCDIKPQNILLDDSFTAKISDFGLAKLLINNKTRTQTGIRGTKGYVAPEWFRNTPITVKVDVYSFGVMLLEIICCRKCVHVEMEEASILTEWAAECYKSGSVEKLVKDDEEAKCDVGKLIMLLKVAIWCVQENPSLRPSMRTVTMMLEGAVLVPPPPYPFLFDSVSESDMVEV